VFLRNSSTTSATDTDKPRTGLRRISPWLRLRGTFVFICQILLRVVDDVRTEIMRNKGVYVPDLATGGR